MKDFDNSIIVLSHECETLKKVSWDDTSENFFLTLTFRKLPDSKLISAFFVTRIVTRLRYLKHAFKKHLLDDYRTFFQDMKKDKMTQEEEDDLFFKVKIIFRTWLMCSNLDCDMSYITKEKSLQLVKHLRDVILLFSEIIKKLEDATLIVNRRQVFFERCTRLNRDP